MNYKLTNSVDDLHRLTFTVDVRPIRGLPDYWCEHGYQPKPPRRGDTVTLLDETFDAIDDLFYLPSLVRPATFLVQCSTGFTWITRINPSVPIWTQATSHASN